MPSRRQVLGDAVLATQPGEHDPDLLLGRMLLPGRPTDLLHHLLGGRSLRHGLLAHLHSLAVTMSQKPSVAQSHQTVPWALTADTKRGGDSGRIRPGAKAPRSTALRVPIQDQLGHCLASSWRVEDAPDTVACRN